MNRWHVYYHDGHYDDGDLGFESFCTKSEAMNFINQRLKFKGVGSNLKNYTLIEGKERELEAVEVATMARIVR